MANEEVDYRQLYDFGKPCCATRKGWDSFGNIVTRMANPDPGLPPLKIVLIYSFGLMSRKLLVYDLRFESGGGNQRRPGGSKEK
jgi:hypothetical protein